LVPRTLRIALTVAGALALWLVALPAFARTNLGFSSVDDVDSFDDEANAVPVTPAPRDERAIEAEQELARAAANAAPLCDERGATRLASAPVVQGTESFLDVNHTAPSCDADSIDRASHHASDGEGTEATASDWLATVPARSGMVLTPDAQRMIVATEAARARPGERTRVERPPRG
jgi:hypothetical protein